LRLACPPLTPPLGFFPNQSSWEHGYNELFVKDGRYSFNDVNYDYDGLKANWQRVYGLVSTKLKSLVILAVDVVTVEDSDGLGGGIVFITGNETGTYLDGSTQNARDAAFGIVKVRSGKRKIVEWREATNYQESKGPS
jgi:hypothetical protein